MKTTFGKLLSGLLAAVTVLCMTVLATVGVCAADCAGGKHAMRYSVVNGELHNACKDCGANDATAEKNADGGPVLYIGRIRRTALRAQAATVLPPKVRSNLRMS